jgi:hypothetical protein
VGNLPLEIQGNLLIGIHGRSWVPQIGTTAAAQFLIVSINSTRELATNAIEMSFINLVVVVTLKLSIFYQLLSDNVYCLVQNTLQDTGLSEDNPPYEEAIDFDGNFIGLENLEPFLESLS